ncbi:unnamed protein product [Strongylus vulgaris]|uniref:Uncharacterized protein n=1 Tax=Strongylus vulgaris TaxID=40348 RepID=A0A3P7JLW4_STRVU|nr:unnamed protein product [Strongylus vulgaris]
MTLWLVVRLLFVACGFYARAEDSQLLNTFSAQLISRFEEQSRAELLDEPFENVKSNIRVKSEYPQEALSSAKKKLEQLFADRTRALQTFYYIFSYKLFLAKFLDKVLLSNID